MMSYSVQIEIESSDHQIFSIPRNVASLSLTLRHLDSIECLHDRNEQDPAPAALPRLPVQLHGSILGKAIEFIQGIADGKPQSFFDRLITENRKILFQLALASKELEVTLLTDLLSSEICKIVRTKPAKEIRQFLGFSDEDDAQEEAEESFEKLPNEDFVIIDGPEHQRTKKLLQAAEKDSTATNCNFCRKEFSITTRKHHCRKCLKLFCHNCANQFTNIPEEERQRAEAIIGTSALTLARNLVVNVASRRSASSVRLCCVCAFEENEDLRVAGTTTVFKLCGFEIPDLIALRAVSRRWTWAADVCIDEMAKLLVCLPTHHFAAAEADILWRNRFHFAGHNRWMVQLLKSIDWTRGEEAAQLLMDGQRRLGCDQLHCSAYCRADLRTEDALELLVGFAPVRHQKVRDAAVAALQKASVEDVLSFMPGLVRALADEACPKQSALFEMLVGIAEQNEDARFNLFWALAVAAQDPLHGTMYSALRDRLVIRLGRRLDNDKVEELVDGFELVDVMRQCSSLDSNKRAQEAIVALLSGRQIMGGECSIPLPVFPSFRTVGVFAEGMVRMSSKVAPTVFPFLGEQAAQGGDGVLEASVLQSSAMTSSFFAPRTMPIELPTYKVGFKREDIRKDWIIQGIIGYMYRCLAQDSIDVPNITYRVLPTSPSDGLVQWVPDCITLSELKQQEKSIQSFISENNQHSSAGDLQRIFMRSLAASTIITFLLLVGDRHNENMMIHRSGIFFHIDYGYVLGHDPKPLLKSNLALRREMVDAIGGRSGQQYQELCARIYNSLRRRAPAIITMMQVLLCSLPAISHGYTVDPRILEVELINRFSINMTDQQAEADLLKCIDGDLESNIRAPLHDHVHDMGKISHVHQAAIKVKHAAAQAHVLVTSAAAAAHVGAGVVFSRMTLAYQQWMTTQPAAYEEFAISESAIMCLDENEMFNSVQPEFVSQAAVPEGGSCSCDEEHDHEQVQEEAAEAEGAAGLADEQDHGITIGDDSADSSGSAEHLDADRVSELFESSRDSGEMD